MKTPNMFKWTGGLRNPELRQVTGKLAALDDDQKIGYCCLGVGCVVANIWMEEHVLTNDEGEFEPDDIEFYFDSEKDLPPPRFHEWLGHTADEGGTDVAIDWPQYEEAYRIRDSGTNPDRGEPMAWSAATLNDELHLAFSQIADTIDYFGIKP